MIISSTKQHVTNLKNILTALNFSRIGLRCVYIYHLHINIKLWLGADEWGNMPCILSLMAALLSGVVCVLFINTELCKIVAV